MKKKKKPSVPIPPDAGPEDFALVDLGEPIYTYPMPPGGSVVSSRPKPKEETEESSKKELPSAKKKPKNP